MLSIVTDRLILKPHTPANLAWFHALINDEDVNYYNGDDPQNSKPEPIENSEAILDHILNRLSDSGFIHYAIHK